MDLSTLIYSDKIFHEGPTLPVAMPGYPCLILINETTVFLAGGRTNQAFFLDWPSISSTELPNLTNTRDFAACGKVGTDKIVIVGDLRNDAGNSS